MVRKKSFWFLLGASVGLTAVLLLALRSEREPEYGGKKLSEWMNFAFSILDL
jgi:hypothetical protein